MNRIAGPSGWQPLPPQSDFTAFENLTNIALTGMTGGQHSHWAGEFDRDTLASLVRGSQTRQMMIEEEHLSMQMTGHPVAVRGRVGKENQIQEANPYETDEEEGEDDIEPEEEGQRTESGGDGRIYVRSSSGEFQLVPELSPAGGNGDSWAGTMSSSTRGQGSQRTRQIRQTTDLSSGYHSSSTRVVRQHLRAATQLTAMSLPVQAPSTSNRRPSHIQEASTIVKLASALAKEGISVFRFDFAGNGESEGSFQYGNYTREADDLRDVVLHFSGSKHVISAILGHSKGGNVVLLYASKYHDMPKVINVSGRFDLKKGIGERLGKDYLQRVKTHGFIDLMNKKEVQYCVTEASLMDRLTTDMHAASLSIEKTCRMSAIGLLPVKKVINSLKNLNSTFKEVLPCSIANKIEYRVLTVHGSMDKIVSVEEASDFAKLIPNHKLQIIEGADHGYSKHLPELANTVLEFIKA
ncbi:hypothetical protein GIB67_043295 [Kingdonia uniflora]|uniref:Serine aminopeptidase S33 domain-containing protein n=1 Tax=Kingdonia uniflora TaxID=39325 RepID=A0A7J7NRN3_9MAGN|nr:hypothetical protein GIB67_043295 [Kingdonia uniflora]